MRSFRNIGEWLGGLIFLAALTAFFQTLSTIPNIPWVLAGSTATSSVNVGNAAPSVTNVVINNGSAITLTPNTTTSIAVTFTVSDGNGCSDVFSLGNVTTTLYRSGVSTTCARAAPPRAALNQLNCYLIATTTNSCVADASANATATLDVYYFAQATDSSSSFASQGWQAFVQVRDSAGLTATSVASAVELNSLLGLSLATSTLNYGTLVASSTTSSTNQIATVKNAGNSSTTLSLNGTAMVAGANSIATSSQHYATSTFTYGGLEQALQETATTVSGFLISRPTFTAWTSTTDMPEDARFHVTVITNPSGGGSYIYKIAGESRDVTNGGATSTVFFAPINPNGSVGSWAKTTALPIRRMNVAGAENNRFIYVVGGRTDATSADVTSTVVFAAVNATGSISNWSSTTVLPTAIEYHQVNIYNNFIYVTGGSDQVDQTNETFFGAITATGSISNWTSTTPLPIALDGHASAIANGFIYTIGGTSGITDTATSTVLVAPITATSAIGNWTRTSPLPSALTTPYARADNGILYVTGGEVTAGTATSTTLFAPIRGDGTLEPWSVGTPLVDDFKYHSGAVNNGYFYITGGADNGNSLQPDVHYTPLASRNTYWGMSVPSGQTGGVYSSTITYTAVFNP